MSLWSRLMTSTSAGASAFRAAWMLNGADDTGEFKQWNARRSRYDVLWSYYEGQPYSALHSHSRGLKVDAGLYKAIRSIYNPAGRLADFYATHLLGGLLRFNSDGGAANAGAFPIETDNDALRLALGQVMRESNWQIAKQVLALRGTVLGDGALLVRDEVDRVYVENVHPASIADVDIDGRGYVRSYKIEYSRTDPEAEEREGRFSLFETADRVVTYTETAERDGDAVVYRTYRNNSPYAWNEGQGSEWEEPYGFIPLVLLQHRNVGNQWGWSEFHKTLSKINEANDQASKLSDQIRKSVDAGWLFAGVEKPTSTPTVTNTADTSGATNQVRQETVVLYAPEGATATPLIAPLDIAGAVSHIQGVLAELENDHPETRLVRLITSGTASGEAIRAAQQPVEAMVVERRSNYDDAVLRAMLMAVSIGGYRNLYPGFDLNSYHAGNMVAQVGQRSVFSTSEDDQVARDTATAQAAAAMLAIGYAPEHYLKDRGWSEDKIKSLTESGTYRNLTFAQYP